VAVFGVVAAGLFGARHNVGAMANVFGNPYGTLLLIKIGLVLAAATLGGANRFLVMPALLDARAAAPRAEAAARRFARVLQAETLVLGAVLVAASLLAATEPPMAG
jgi:putative copper resistance protein D